MAQARKKVGKKKAVRSPAKKKPGTGKKTATRKRANQKAPIKKKKKVPVKKKAGGRKVAKKKVVKKKSAKAEPREPAPTSTSRTRTASFEDLIANHLPEVQETARRLRSIVYDVLPKAVETVYLSWRIAIYREPREVCGIQPVRGRCNFYLTDGAHLSDPGGLLQGTAANTRYLRISRPADIPLAPLKQLIREGHRFARMGRPVAEPPADETKNSA